MAWVALGLVLPVVVPSTLGDQRAPDATRTSEAAAFLAPAPLPAAPVAAPTTVAWPLVLPVAPATAAPAPPVAPRVASSAARQAWLWPFAADSPWNAGVGAAARYEQSTDSETAALVRGDVRAWVNADQYSQPVYRATVLDPVATVQPASAPAVQYRIPDVARPAAGTDANLNVVEPSGRWADESWHMRGQNPSWTSGHHLAVDLFGSGFGCGVRASGASAIGGLIRQWELDVGSIRHALALAITGDQLRRGPVWPATSEDGDAAGSYTGPVPMGAFAAIPRGVDVGSLGLSPIGLALARAMQDYGVFVVDRTAGAVALYAEPTVGGGQLAELRQAFGVLRGQLRIVTDDGGARVVAPPPPLL